MNFVITLLLQLINFQSSYTQIISKEDVKEYLNTLTTLMWQNLKDYGISNLPDIDSKVTYNVSNAHGYSLVGNLYFEDGFIMDISNIPIFSQDNNAVTSGDTSHITCNMKIEDLRILRDFRYESEKGHITDRSFGSVIIAPNIVQLSVVIKKYFKNNTVNVQCSRDFSNYQPGKKLLTFYPDNGLTKRLKKNNLRPPVVTGIWELWYPIFSRILEDIVKKVEFPSILYDFS